MACFLLYSTNDKQHVAHIISTHNAQTIPLFSLSNIFYSRLFPQITKLIQKAFLSFNIYNNHK